MLRLETLPIYSEAAARLKAVTCELGVADVVRTLARLATGADGATVVFKRGERVFYVDEDAIGPLWKGQDFPIDACISGWAIKHRQTVAIDDIFNDDRIPVPAYRPTFVKSLVMAPVRPLDPLAAIGAYWSDARRASVSEIAALEEVARVTALALQRVREQDLGPPPQLPN